MASSSAASSSSVFIEQTPEPKQVLHFQNEITIKKLFTPAQLEDWSVHCIDSDGKVRSLKCNKQIILAFSGLLRRVFTPKEDLYGKGAKIDYKELADGEYTFQEFPGGSKYLFAILEYALGEKSTPMLMKERDPKTGLMGTVDRIQMALGMVYLEIDTEKPLDSFLRNELVAFKKRYFKYNDAHPLSFETKCPLFIRSIFAPCPVPNNLRDVQWLLAHWMQGEEKYVAGGVLTPYNALNMFVCNLSIVNYLKECYPLTDQQSKVHILRIFGAMRHHSKSLVRFVMGIPPSIETTNMQIEEEFTFIKECDTSEGLYTQLVVKRAKELHALNFKGFDINTEEFWKTRFPAPEDDEVENATEVSETVKKSSDRGLKKKLDFSESEEDTPIAKRRRIRKGSPVLNSESDEDDGIAPDPDTNQEL
jgi:hypothetical protein